MDISSLYQYGSLYMPTYSASTSSAAQSSSQDDTGSEDFGTIFGSTLSNSDGDTVQLSSSGMAGMPPMMGNDTTASDLQSFMNEVANGTATATDLQNMETELEQVQQQAALFNSAISAYSNNNAGYLSNSMQDMTA